MRLTFLTTVAILFVFHRAAPDEDSRSCKTPRGRVGFCRHIDTCKPLRNLQRHFGSVFLTLVPRIGCPSNPSKFMVCCPPIYDDDNDEYATKIKLNPSYKPLLPPACGSNGKEWYNIDREISAKLGDWPWATMLGYHGIDNPNVVLWLCGGSLISSRHVLTAAHCVHERKDLFLARIGDLDLNSDDDGAEHVDVIIERSTIDPRFEARTRVNDIAVLRLREDVKFGRSIQPICLPNRGTMSITGELFEFDSSVIGWGSVRFSGPMNSVLRHVELPILNGKRCRSVFRHFKNVTIDKRVLCAGWEQIGDEACVGDSGGPLILTKQTAYYIIGVVSYGYKCGDPLHPTIFTRVTSFLDFIRSQLD